MAKLVSKVYGDALFELAVEENSVDKLFEDAQGVIQVLDATPEFSQMMNHPKISKEKKLEIIEVSFKGNVSDALIALLLKLEEKGHAKDMKKVLTYFIDRVYEYKKIGRAKVSTPMELSESQKRNLVDRLLATTSYVSFEVEYEIDPTLIGGMVIRINDRVVDSSIKTKLSSLTKELSNIQLKVGECAP